MVPTPTRKMEDYFPDREKSGNFEHAGKVSKFYPNYRKSWGIFNFFCHVNFKLFFCQFFPVILNLTVFLKKKQPEH